MIASFFEKTTNPKTIATCRLTAGAVWGRLAAITNISKITQTASHGIPQKKKKNEKSEDPQTARANLVKLQT